MPRCIGRTKTNKRCRRKIHKKNEYYCCEKHKPINKDVITTECFMCSEIVNPKKLWLLECGHAFHRECLKEWMNHLLNNEDTEFNNDDDYNKCLICSKKILVNIEKKKQKIPFEKKIYKSNIINSLNTDEVIFY